jgi:hypothetical protein
MVYVDGPDAHGRKVVETKALTTSFCKEGAKREDRTTSVKPAPRAGGAESV